MNLLFRCIIFFFFKYWKAIQKSSWSFKFGPLKPKFAWRKRSAQLWIPTMCNCLNFRQSNCLRSLPSLSVSRRPLCSHFQDRASWDPKPKTLSSCVNGEATTILPPPLRIDQSHPLPAPCLLLFRREPHRSSTPRAARRSSSALFPFNFLQLPDLAWLSARVQACWWFLPLSPALWPIPLRWPHSIRSFSFSYVTDTSICLELHSIWFYFIVKIDPGFCSWSKFGFCTSVGFGGSLDQNKVLEFVDAGHDLILAVDSSASDLIRGIATDCGADFDEVIKIKFFQYLFAMILLC